MPTLPEKSLPPSGLPPSSRAGHEESDVPVSWILALVFLLFVGGVVIHFTLGWQLRALTKTPPPTDPWTGPKRSADAPTTSARDFPRLQVSPAADLEAFRAREQAVLDSYGWINRTAGVVRIPVRRAMDVIVEEGLLPVSKGTNGLRLARSPLELQRERALESGSQTQKAK